MLQISRGDRDNLGIISHTLHENIFCDPSLELSHRDGSNIGVTTNVHENIFCDPSLEPSQDSSNIGVTTCVFIEKKKYL